MNSKGINLQTIGIPEIRHFLYKSKSNAQLLCSEITAPYNTPDEFNRLESLYYDIHHRIHNSNRPTKLIYQLRETEIVLAWVNTIVIILMIALSIASDRDIKCKCIDFLVVVVVVDMSVLLYV